MRKSILLVAVLAVCIQVMAQPDPPRRDTLWGSWPDQPYYDGILRAPVVTGETMTHIITPNSQKLCFDKMIRMKVSSSSGLVEQCMYLNTTDGYLGLLPPNRGAATCDIKPDDPKFIFWVYSLKGNVYTYKNNEKNGQLQHHVMTGNTQVHLANTAGSPGTATLHKKTERRGYEGDKIKTWAYKVDGPAPVYFLFGKTFPEEINVSSNKYLGMSGVGYMFTDKGLYIVMEMNGDGFTAKISELKEVNVCFDPAAFTVLEDQFYTKAFEGIEKEKQKIRRDEARATGDCSSEKMAVIQYRKEQVAIQEERLRTSQQGNVYTDPRTQQALGQLMDYAAIAHQQVLELKVSLCSAQKRLSEARSESARQSASEKIDCINEQIGKMTELESQLRAIDARNADNPGKAQVEKAQLFMRNMPRGC